MSKEQGMLLVMKKDGTFVRSKLKSLRVHENGITKQLNDFSGEVIIEEGTDNLSLDMLRQSSQKNERGAVGAMFGMSVLLIIFGMAIHHFMLLHSLR